MEQADRNKIYLSAKVIKVPYNWDTWHISQALGFRLILNLHQTHLASLSLSFDYIPPCLDNRGANEAEYFQQIQCWSERISCRFKVRRWALITSYRWLHAFMSCQCQEIVHNCIQFLTSGKDIGLHCCAPVLCTWLLTFMSCSHLELFYKSCVHKFSSWNQNDGL